MKLSSVNSLVSLLHNFCWTTNFIFRVKIGSTEDGPRELAGEDCGGNPGEGHPVAGGKIKNQQQQWWCR